VKFVKPGSKINTDEGSNFRLLKERYGFDHEMVDHSAKEYVRGDVHTNTIEAFWANVKRGIRGTYVWVSKKHLQTYLREFEYRHNLRHLPYVMFDCLLQGFSQVRVDLPSSARVDQNAPPF
jgi:transposase